MVRRSLPVANQGQIHETVKQLVRHLQVVEDLLSDVVVEVDPVLRLLLRRVFRRSRQEARGSRRCRSLRMTTDNHRTKLHVLVHVCARAHHWQQLFGGNLPAEEADNDEGLPLGQLPGDLSPAGSLVTMTSDWAPSRYGLCTGQSLLLPGVSPPLPAASPQSKQHHPRGYGSGN